MTTEPTGQRLAVRVTKDAERQIRGGHPWVFDQSITSMKPETGTAGDLAVIFDAKRQFLAIGMYDPASPMRVRVLHQGRPMPIDAEWWSARVAEAVARRTSLASSELTNAYRVIHGENDRMPGLVVDRYANTLVVKLYSEAWFPHLRLVVDVLIEQVPCTSVVLRLARNLQRGAELPNGWRDGAALVGNVPLHPVPFVENGLCFEADVIHGQKTGYFLDQRENRARVGDLAEGRRVLDVYSCAGGFSVYAAAGGAREVHSVDISPGAIAAARRNMAANAGLAAVAACHHTAATGDAIDEMQRLVRDRRRFDLVVVDPPSFASRKEQREGALRAYGRLAELAASLVEPGGLLVQASCSSRVSADEHFAMVRDGAARGGRSLTGVVRTAHPIDHPVGFAEGAYLKAVFTTAERTRRRSGSNP